MYLWLLLINLFISLEVLKVFNHDTATSAMKGELLQSFERNNLETSLSLRSMDIFMNPARKLKDTTRLRHGVKCEAIFSRSK